MAGKPIKFTIVGDTKDIEKGLNRTEQALEEAGDTAKKAGRKIDSALDSTAGAADGVASKGAQAAGALSGLGDLIGGRVGGAMQVGAVGMQAFADAGDLVNVALESTILKKVRDIAVSVAHRAAMIAASVASKAMAAAQWLVNAAMSANPIGLVIIAIIALVAGIVLLWNKSETFRTIVLALWGAIKTAIKATADWILNVAWPAIKKVWDAFMAANRRILAVVVDAWGKVSDFIGRALDAIKQANARIWAAVQKVIDVMFRKVPNTIRDKVGQARRYLVSGFTGAYNVVRDKVQAIYDSVRDKFDRVVSFVSRLGGRIRSAARGIWDGITAAFRAAINGIISRWNRLSFTIPGVNLPGIGYVGGATLNTPNIPYLASGGITTGPTLAMIGDNPGGREAIIPLDKYDIGASNTYNITVNAAPGVDRAALGRELVDVIRSFERSQGRRAAIGGA